MAGVMEDVHAEHGLCTTKNDGCYLHVAQKKKKKKVKKKIQNKIKNKRKKRYSSESNGIQVHEMDNVVS
jgi:hypothetical protein